MNNQTRFFGLSTKLSEAAFNVKEDLENIVLEDAAPYHRRPFYHSKLFSSLVVVPVYWLPGRGWLLLIQSSSVCLSRVRVFEQSSCVLAEFVCLSREQQSSVFEQREPRNADFVHTARCQFALSQADCGSVFWTGYLWRKCFIHDDGRVGP